MDIRGVLCPVARLTNGWVCSAKYIVVPETLPGRLAKNTEVPCEVRAIFQRARGLGSRRAKSLLKSKAWVLCAHFHPPRSPNGRGNSEASGPVTSGGCEISSLTGFARQVHFLRYGGRPMRRRFENISGSDSTKEIRSTPSLCRRISAELTSGCRISPND